MTDFLTEYLRTLFSLLADSAPFLLLGFLIAGLLRALIPRERVYRHLGTNDFRSVLRAALFGIPLPLCSCSVLPTATSLRKHGASKGATAAFLVSTPETGPDSIGLTFALLGPLMALLRPLVALFTALLTGGLVNRLVNLGHDRGGIAVEPGDQSEEKDPAGPPRERRSLRRVLAEAYSFAFGPLLDELTPWFIVGFLVSAAVAVAFPQSFFTKSLPGEWASLFLMLVLGIPIYICAAAATPLAAALVAKGLSPGAALVLLLVGPATNVTTILVVLRLLGRRAMAIYLATVAGSALLFGVVVDGIYRDLGIDLGGRVTEKLAGGVSVLEIAGAVVFLLLLARSARRSRLLPRFAKRLRSLEGFLGFDPTGRRARVGAGALVLVLWLLTSLSVVGPGEVGWVVRFGAVRREVREPGLVVHFPAPIDSLTKLRAGSVRALALGFARTGPGDRAGTATPIAPAPLPGSAELTEQARVVTGDESLIRITFGVQYVVADAYAYRYRVEAPRDLVLAFAESAVREAVARRSADEVLIGHRAELETETASMLQSGLESVGAGVRILAVAFRDVHAPEPVHYAFRDVASALEEKERDVRDAEGTRTATVAVARGRSYRLEREAEGYRADRVGGATGESAAFLSRLAAFRGNEDLTRLRLYLEAAEAVLPGTRMYLLLGDDADVDFFDFDKDLLNRPEGR